MPKRNFPLQGKTIQGRKYAKRACKFCNISHLRCDNGRPCQNCVKRQLDTSCIDMTVMTKRKPKKVARAKSIPQMTPVAFPNFSIENVGIYMIRNNSCNWSHESSIFPMRRYSNDSENTLINFSNWTSSKENFVSETAPNNNNSNGGYENATSRSVIHNQLGPPTMKRHNSEQIVLQSPGSVTSQVNKNISNRPLIRNQISQPNIFDKMENNNLQNPPNNDINFPILHNFPPYVPPQQINKVENIKQSEIGSSNIGENIENVADLFKRNIIIKPHDYRNAFIKLQNYFTEKLRYYETQQLNYDENVSHNNVSTKIVIIQIIRQYIGQFTCFAPIMNNELLVDHETIFNQKLITFQESLKKTTQNIIVAIWRRSGEICYINIEFLKFFQCTNEEILNQTRFIFEFWDDEMTYRYMSKYNDTMNFTRDDAIQFLCPPAINVISHTDETDLLTPLQYCDLIRRNGTTIRSAVNITIEKDTNSIPILIIGQLFPLTTF